MRFPKILAGPIIAANFLGCSDDPCKKILYDENYDPTYEVEETSNSTAECVAKVYETAYKETTGLKQADGTLQTPETVTVCGKTQELESALVCIKTKAELPDTFSIYDILRTKIDLLLPELQLDESSPDMKIKSLKPIADESISCTFGAYYENGGLDLSENGESETEFVNSALSLQDNVFQLVTNLCQNNQNNYKKVWETIQGN